MTDIEFPDWLMQAIVTIIILPIIYFPINAYLSRKFMNDDLYSEGKNAYRNFLLKNSKPIDDLFHKLDEYKNHTQMKYFFFLEGVPLGMSLLLFLMTFSFSLSKNKYFFSLLPFLQNYYNYAYNGQKDTDLVCIILSLNCFITTLSIFILLFIVILYLYDYGNPKLTEKLLLKKWSKAVYYSYWLSIGLVIGFNVTSLLFTLLANNQFIKVIKTPPSYKIFFLLFLYLMCLFSSWLCIFVSYRSAKHFSNRVEKMITDFYIDNFPDIRVRTNGEDICGKVDDIHDEVLITLKESCSLKAIRWDQITTMEIEKTLVEDKITMEPLPEVIQYKPWWKFWKV